LAFTSDLPTPAACRGSSLPNLFFFFISPISLCFDKTPAGADDKSGLGARARQWKRCWDIGSMHGQRQHAWAEADSATVVTGSIFHPKKRPRATV
jgi:hypothetical protein